MSESFNKRLSDALDRTSDCPALDDLLDLLAGRKGEEDRVRAEAHATACAHCSTEVALFREFENATPRPEESTDVAAIVARLQNKSPVATVPWWKKLTAIQWGAPVAVALAALLMGVFVWPTGPAKGTAPRIGENETVRSGRIQSVAPAGTVSVRPEKLEWQAVKGAVRYQVKVSEVDRTPIWAATVEPSQIALPEEVLGKVVPHKTLIWQVSAVDNNGARLAESGLIRFQLVPSQN